MTTDVATVISGPKLLATPPLQPAALPQPSGGRIRTIDWLRGLSVLAMLIVHAQAFLSPAHDHDAAREVFNQIGGLPAPTFIFAAGFSLSLVTARATGDVAKRRARARKSLLRIGQVLLGSLVLRQVMWESFRHPERWWWIDVLTCIALMLVGTWVVLFVLPARRIVRYTAFAVMAGACFAVTPWVEAPRTFGPFTTLLNNGVYGDTWPLVPWAAYGWLGAIAGLIVSAAPAAAQRGRLAYAFVGIAILGLLMRYVGASIYAAIDPRVSSWMITNAGDRLWRIAVIGIGFCWLEMRGFTFVRGRIKPVGVLVELFSRQSLVAYVVHLLLLYGYFGKGTMNWALYRLDWPAYAGMTCVLIAGTAAICTAVERWRRWRQRDAARSAQAGSPAISS